MSDYVLRQAVPEDAPLVSELIRKSMQTYGRESGISFDMLESLHESIESVADRISHNRCLCLFDGNTPVGTLTLTTVNNPVRYSFSLKTETFLSGLKGCVYISRFAVADELRGKGLGVKLMEAALTEPEVTASGMVLLHTAVRNKRMHRFYTNRGFKLLDSENSRGYKRGLYFRPV